MGKNIVFKESQHNPGNRSRLWLQEDIDHVLRMNKGSEFIQAIALEPQEPYEAHWDPKAFTNMCNLRLLKISNVHLPLGLKYLPNSLKVLEWEGCSLKALPIGVQDELVDLRMLRSKMIKPWNGTRFFGKLKSIDLSHSKDLTQTPIISGIPHLERLILEGCTSLVKIHQSIGQHNKLVELNVKDCINLKSFPGKIEMSSLKNFILSGCSKIQKLPDFGENMESLSVLDLKDCINVVCLPNTIRYLKSLKTLNISGCPKLSQLPNNMDENEALEELNVSGTAIRDLISSHTMELTLSPRWKFMRPSIPIGMMHTPILRLSFLKELSLASCNLIDGSIPDDLSCLSSLHSIDLSGNDFVNLPVYCIANLSKLCSLSLNSCTRLEMLPVLPQYLESLNARDCASLQPIFDRLQLWNLFPLDEHEIKPSAQRALFITGSAIPPWFDNENFAFCDAEAAHLNFDVDSIISIVVDIPQYCRESEWWRVDVCLVLEYVESSTLISRDPSDSFISFVYIMGKATEPDSPLYYDFVIRKFVTLDRPHLWITSLRTLHEHLRGDSNRLHLFFFTTTYPKFGKMKIRQGGCHVYCKEEAESWHRARNYLENTIPSNSEYSSSLRVSLPTPAVSTGQEVEELPMTSDTLNNSKENILPAQMQEPNPNKDRSNKMCAKPSPSMSETSGSRFRFLNKRCICEQIAALRVSESEELYYVCEDNKCNYFEWWSPSSSSDKNRCSENVGHELQLPQLKIDEFGVLRMHDLLQRMGRNIVSQESQYNPGNRSRLWSQEDIDQVLRMKKGTELIQGIVLGPQEPYEAYWDPEAFTKMCNLRLLKLSNVHLPLGLKCLPNSLKVLEWEGCSLKALPLGVQDELVDLRMHHSKMIKTWNGTRFFGKLNSVDLSHSKDLAETPIVSGIPYLERLILEGCTSLVKVHQSVGQHNKLVELNLKDCINLKTFPSKLEMSSLKNFILSGCSKVHKLPDFGENMESLSVLDLKDCKNIVCLPNTIRNLKSLKILDISGCPKLSQLPNNMDENEALEELDVSGAAIRDLISSNSMELPLSSRWKFIRHSTPLDMMHTPILQFSFLKELSFASCNLIDGSIPDDLSCLSSLQRIDLSGNDFVNLPVYCIANLSKLCSLSLDSCTRLEKFPVLPQYLENLSARDCASLQPIYDPLQLWNLFSLDEHKIKPSARRYSFITGSVIPPWFHNQNFTFLDAEVAHLNLDLDSIVSIVVDIPQYCRESEWWRVDACLVLEYVESSPRSRDPSESFLSFVYTRVKATEPGFPSYHDFLIHLLDTLDGPHLWITSLRTLHEQLRGDSNQLELLFFTRTVPHYGTMKIRQCGCHVYGKEDAESWHIARNNSENIIPSNSDYSRISLPIASAAAVSTGQLEQLPMTSDALNNSRENVLLPQMQEPEHNEDKSNKMSLKPRPSMGETSGPRLRFRNKRCICEQRAALRVSESEKLYYVCENNKCNYFEWWIPDFSSDENLCYENGGQELLLPEKGKHGDQNLVASHGQLKLLVMTNLILSIFAIICLCFKLLFRK
ncbi:hypothetical protein L6164_029094 [Bauhinia variegata]|uniref:Uncharacterized protein n=1 Tax=Bauhinia variegata TaxID=167791 RepID=A0ACB9L8K5_BAUVA|nr:hypothetical protein L6164_029094 [Bauhinia variegata]